MYCRGIGIADMMSQSSAILLSSKRQRYAPRLVTSFPVGGIGPNGRVWVR